MRIRRCVVVVLAIFMTVGLLQGCAQKTAQEDVSIPLTPVEACDVVKGGIQSTYTISGQIKPSKEVAVYAKAPGKVEHVAKEIGDKVQKDEVLFSMDKKDLIRQIEQLDIKLKSDKTNYEMAALGVEQAKGSAQEQQLMEMEAALKQAEIAYKNAKDNYEKNKLLYDAGALSEKDMNNLKDALSNAEINYNRAKDNYNLLKEKLLSESVQSAQLRAEQAVAAIEATEVQRKQAMDALEDYNVKAPISGIIAFKNVEAGAQVSTQAPAYTIVDMNTVVVESTVTERVINSIAKGQEVVVKIDALGGKTFKGTIDALSPSTTGNNVGYPLKVTIPNENHEIKPGMFAEISIVIEQKNDVLLIPLETVLTENEKNYVYVLDGDIVRKREIETGLKDEKNYEIIDGLKEGERIILKGQNFIADGEKVQVVGGVN